MKVKKKRVIILGSTGSIGNNALDVIRRNPSLFEVAALSCSTAVRQLAEQIEEFAPDAVALTDLTDVSLGSLKIACYTGCDGLLNMIENIEADLILNGISGSAGLIYSLKTIETGRDLALANKETIVMAGPQIMKMAAQRGVRILPVDSEHSALFHILEFLEREKVSEILLTASGGAFRDLPVEKLADVRPKDAFQHPIWKMGPKITVDSATMANKGLEVIEAMYLFNMDSDRIKVLIHPQSCIHSMIKTLDGNIYAQIGKPDMRNPIQNALSYPDMIRSDFADLDFAELTLSFHPWSPEKYPLLALAYQAAQRGGAAPIVYNAANEVAVRSFISGEIPFSSIADLVRKTLDGELDDNVNSVDDILELDRKTKVGVRKIIGSKGIC